MTFSAEDPSSPLFIVLMLGFLLSSVYAYSGLLKGELPNMRTSMRGARVAGVLSVVAMLCIFASYWFYTNVGELNGSILAIMAASAFLGGLVLAERIPD